jgi:hypothetical protein
MPKLSDRLRKVEEARLDALADRWVAALDRFTDPEFAALVDVGKKLDSPDRWSEQERKAYQEYQQRTEPISEEAERLFSSEVDRQHWIDATLEAALARRRPRYNQRPGPVGPVWKGTNHDRATK